MSRRTATLFAFAAVLAVPAAASASDPTRTDVINKTLGGKTFSGTVSYPWPTRWKNASTAWWPSSYRYSAEDLGGGCTARVTTREVLLAIKDSAMGGIPSPDFTFTVPSGPPRDAHAIAFGVSSAREYWLAFEENVIIAEENLPTNPRQHTVATAVTRLAKNRYLRHTSVALFFGTCTLAQRTAGPTVEALVASVRDQTVKITIRAPRRPVLAR
ncbi:unannotated protein [freshwater metagenome]|uniref:Unannotated protein n=1 Tax=freshwater metagenome TaxID=449393 RepID=A0A6J7IZL0_9ZZZZ|nr:hypothetical protein [Actinomycetota bacterium]